MTHNQLAVQNPAFIEPTAVELSSSSTTLVVVSTQMHTGSGEEKTGLNRSICSPRASASADRDTLATTDCPDSAVDDIDSTEHSTSRSDSKRKESIQGVTPAHFLHSPKTSMTHGRPSPPRPAPRH